MVIYKVEVVKERKPQISKLINNALFCNKTWKIYEISLFKR